MKGIRQAICGRIRTHNKVTYTEKHGKRFWKDKILKFKPSSPNKKTKQGTGYRVTLWKNGKAKDFLVHRLIATTFLENLIDTNMTVNHKDGNRLNNKVENLEWLSLKENIQYGFENGQYKQHNIVLLDKETNTKHFFNSKAKASIFLQRNKGYISNRIKKGCQVFDKYEKEYIVINN